MEVKSPFQGVWTALITPFQGNEIDWDSLRTLIRSQLDHGANGFVVLGTTAESPTLSESEKEKIFSFVKSEVAQQIPLIVGTGSNDTKKTIEATKKARQWGAHASLVVTPYYNKPPQRGLFQHFKSVAIESDFPLFLYNVPGRTGVSLEAETVHQLSEIPQILGIKEASGKMDLFLEMKKGCRKDFIFLSGDDETYLDFLAMSGQGTISVASHILPQKMGLWRKQILEGKESEARKDFEKHLELIRFLFVEANPIPVKRALQILKIVSSAELRLPLVELSSDLSRQMESKLKSCGVLL